mgnify:CR=1 FL=1
MTNLDKICAEFAQKIAKELSQSFNNNPKKAEILINKALGVLQEQGLYAFVLFCMSRGKDEKDGAEKLKTLTGELLKDELKLIGNGDILNEIINLSANLDSLMLAIQVLEKTLIYARYHAKAHRESSKETQTAGE